MHRDLKPGNIYGLTESGLVKLVDFGLAKLVDPGFAASDFHFSYQDLAQSHPSDTAGGRRRDSPIHVAGNKPKARR